MHKKKKTTSLHSKISTAILITCIVIAAFFSAIVYPFAIQRNHFRYEQIRLLLDVVFQQRKASLGINIAAGKIRALADVLKDISAVRDISEVSAYNQDGRLLWAETGERGRIIASPTNILSGGHKLFLPSPSFEVETHQNQPLAAYSAAIEAQGQHVGYIRIYYDLSEMERETRLTITFFITLLLTVLLLMSFLLNFLLTRFVVRPLSMLRKAMYKVQDGFLGEQIHLPFKDEIGDMAVAFNEMSANLSEKSIAIMKAIQEKESYAAELEQVNTELEHSVAKLEQENTERRRAEEALTRAEEKYRSIFENALEGIYQSLPDGRFISANPAMARILGYNSPIELIASGADITSLYVYPEDRKTFNDLLEQRDQVTNFKTRLYQRDKHVVWVSVSARTVRDENGEILFYEGATADITAEKEKEKAQQEREAAEAANRAKSEFLATMSHEIRTPMNAIFGFTELLEGKIQDEQQRQYLSAITSSGKTLLSLIDDILDLSKIEAGKIELYYEAVSPHSIFNEIRQIFSHKINEKGLDFHTEIDPSLPEGLLLDALRLRQIFLNLVGNAVKFTDNGYVKLSLSPYYAAASENTKALSEGHEEKLDIVFSVQDTGIGMREEHRELIFKAFEQQNRQISAKYGGTGLGLTITKRLVEMMGGEILVESEPGKGSTFHVILKDVSPASLTEISEPADNICVDAVTFEKALILVVDDIISNRDLIRGFLAEYPELHIIEAKDGKEAIDMTEFHRPDMILMDIKMPIMDGYEATRIIKKNTALKSIPVIAVTASVIATREHMIKSTEYDGFLRKPITKTELVTELMRFLPYTSDASSELASEKSDSDSSFPSSGLGTKSGLSVQISPETKARLPELIHTLENEMTVIQNRLLNTFIFNEIEDFANQISALGSTYNVTMLTDWGKRLLKQAKCFDMENLPKTLNDFPELIKRLVNGNNG